MNSKIALTRPVKLDVREAWKHEALDFTRWLSEEDNLKQLSDTVGIDMSLQKIESDVGDFRVDMVCTEDGSERTVVIENQLEQTDHDHLGKIITYAAGKGAETVIWCVSKARDEHAKAIEFLNSHMDGINFFLIEIELWKVGDQYAPHFNVVEKPNDWVKVTERDLTPREQFCQSFWTRFNEVAIKNKDFIESGFTCTSAWYQSFYNLRIKRSNVHLTLSVKTWKKEVSVAIYIRKDKATYKTFQESQKEIEQRLGLPVVWTDAAKDSTIRVAKPCNVEDQSCWNDCMTWLCKYASIMRDIVDKTIPNE